MTVTTQVTFCRDEGLFTIATIATQVFQQISLRRCTKTHQKPLYMFAKQAFCPKTLRRCTKTVHIDAFLLATHVFRPFFLRRCTCVDHCDVFGSENDTALIIYIGVYMQVYTMMSYRRFTHTVIPTESSEWRNLSREHP